MNLAELNRLADALGGGPYIRTLVSQAYSCGLDVAYLVDTLGKTADQLETMVEAVSRTGPTVGGLPTRSVDD